MGCGLEMRGGGRTSQRWIGNNILVTNHPKLVYPNCYEASAWGWNTTKNNISACHIVAETGKKKTKKGQMIKTGRSL